MTELPTTFGKYYLTEKLATGGMAEIYLAKLIGPGGFEKQLVIKQIHPRLTGQRQFVDLFVAEAKTLVTLAHGNIVPVYELGVVDDTYFIAMDYIDGPTLYRLTETMARRDAAMEPAVAAWITARMLDGLDYAHRKGDGVIHRDLSPRNVMLSRDGDVKLVDFGIAVTLGEPGEGSTPQSAPTGSFPYMSPEQVRREQLTGQTDLFSVGVLMWEMLAGRRLFHRSDADATLAAVLDEVIAPPSSVRPEVPARLDEVVMRALERDRSRRWPSASEVLAALNKYLYSLDATPGPREVAALVARFCPPETRRLPTHLEALAHDVSAPDPLAVAPERERPAASGPATAVIPRDGAATGPSTAVLPRDGVARGKQQRHTSFATNVDLAPIFEATGQLAALTDEASADGRPTTKQNRPPRDGELPSSAQSTSRDTGPSVPALTTACRETKQSLPALASASGTEPNVHALASASRETEPNVPALASASRGTEPSVPALVDGSRDTAPPARPDGPQPRRSHPRLAVVKPDDDDAPIARPPPRSVVPGRDAPGRGALVLAGLGAIALAVAAVVVFYRGREGVLASEAHRDAGTLESLHEATAVTAGDAALSTPSDERDAAAGLAADAGVGGPPIGHDAGAHAAPANARAAKTSTSASTKNTPTDAGAADAPAARGTATLKIGADPWGEIYVDGKLVGRTPRELVVPAGRHTIEIVFPAETPPRKHTFAVDLAAGEIKPLQADFQ